MNKEFKKGERVYVHSRDTRDSSYDAIVTSVGRKYITCNQIWEDGTVSMDSVQKKTEKQVKNMCERILAFRIIAWSPVDEFSF